MPEHRASLAVGTHNLVVVDADPGGIIIQPERLGRAVFDTGIQPRRSQGRGRVGPATLDLGAVCVTPAKLVRLSLQGKQLVATPNDIG